MNILVTGGAGYCGSVLTPQLLNSGHKVTVYDMLYYGSDFLPLDNPDLTVIQGDIRETAKLAAALEGIDAVLNLAAISNDASFELDENLSTSVNMDAFEPMVLAAKAAGVEGHRKAMFKGEPTGLELLAKVRPVLEGLSGFDAASIETAITGFVEEHAEGNLGRIAQPLRVAVSGGPISPPIFDTLAILGQRAVLARIDRCLEVLSESSPAG